MKQILLFPILLFFISNCSDNGLNFSFSEIEDDFSNIENPRERWEAYGLDDYSIEQSWSCECFPPNEVKSFIVNEKIREIEIEDNPRNGEGDSYSGYSKEQFENAKKKAITINGAFELIEEYEGKAFSIQVEYHPKFGYPTDINIDIAEMIADEEIHYRFHGLKKIVSF